LRPLWTSAEIAQATGGVASADFDCDSVTFDSREVIGGELFVAMKGETADGHDFVDSAFERGAAGAIVSRPVDHPHVLVKDGLAALDALGRAGRERATNATIFGITGSVGKTSVKEALRHALAAAEPECTHWSVKSYNNHTGVPLSLARMPADTRYGVFEMGMNHAGELSALTQIVRPHIAIVNAIAPAHIENFETIEGIADAKAEIFEGLMPEGTAVLPLESDHFERLRGHAKRYAARIVTFGLSTDADVHLEREGEAEAGERRLIARVDDTSVSFSLSQPGKHWTLNALATLAMVHAAGGDLAAAGLGLSALGGLEGRGAQHKIPWQDGEVLVLDESYNANSASMAAALAVLGDMTVRGRRVAVLGAMRELGTRSDALHRALAEPIRAANVESVAFVGDETAPIADALNAPRFDSAAEAEDWLRSELRAGDAVLLKGSNSVGLGQVVSSLLTETD
jgi:UDP-N-acetylmuramoyl-tripeptide--D-alanyl-D-alanine ligase